MERKNKIDANEKQLFSNNWCPACSWAMAQPAFPLVYTLSMKSYGMEYPFS